MKGQADLSWYEMAVKFEALYQEEVLAHERAATNLSCYKIEADERLRQAAEVEMMLRDDLIKCNVNLEEGLQIMKKLEEELMEVQNREPDTTELEEKQDMINRLEEELDEMKHNVSKAETVAKKAKAEAKTIGDENEKLRETVHHLQVDLKDRVALCSDMEKKLANSREDMKQLTNQLKVLESKERQRSKEKTEDLKNLALARDNISSLETKVTEMESEHSSLIAQLEADYLRDIDERCADIISLQNELSQYKLETPQLKTEVQVYKTEVDELKKQVQEQSRHFSNETYLSKLRIAEKRLEILEGNELKLKTNEKLVEDFRTQNLLLQEKLRTILSDASKEQQHYLVMEKKHMADVNILQDQLAAAYVTNRDLTQKCSNLEQMVKELQSSFATKKPTLDAESGSSKVLADSAALKKFMRDRKRQ